MSRKKGKGQRPIECSLTSWGSFGIELNDVRRCKNELKKRYGMDMYWQTSDYNTRLFMMFRAQILGMALSRFKWVGLPKTCDTRYLEMTLILQGQASIAFPKRQKGVFYSTQLAQVGRPNLYDNPTAWRAIGNNGFNFNADWSNGVVVWDNRVRYPLLEKINIWARELVDIVRTKQLNRQHQKIPFVFGVPQEMEQQALNLYKQVSGGEPAVIATPEISRMQPEVWNTDVQFIGEELTAEEENIWNEIYLALGIAHQTYKNERMIEDEVRSQKEPSEFVRLDSLNCMREAAKKLNDRFGEYLDKEIKVIWDYDNASENYNYLYNIKEQLDSEAVGEMKPKIEDRGE